MSRLCGKPDVEQQKTPVVKRGFVPRTGIEPAHPCER